MAEITANQIADYFLNFCHEHGDVLTNLKLQKLVYYAQAWYLALNDKPLFGDRVEAWVHGPVIPPLYRRFRKHGWKPITEKPRVRKIAGAIEKHLVQVFSVYGHYSAWDLERMTHQEEPWIAARKGLEPDDEGHGEIAREHMRDFYGELAKQA